MLWKRDESADLESYVAIHLGVIFGALTLVTGLDLGQAPAGATGGTGSENQLVLFLVLFLFYCRLLHAALLRSEPGRGARTSARSTRCSASC